MVRAKGIQLFVNLYHFDLPYCLQEKGGWENKEIVRAYEAYARTCFELFDDLVDRWITFNEPIVPVECGYLEIIIIHVRLMQKRQLRWLIIHSWQVL